MLNLDHLSFNSSLQDLPSHQCHVNIEVLGSVIAMMLEKQQDLPGVILMDNNNFVGVVSRRRYLENVGQPFGVDVYMNRPIKIMLETILDEPLILPDDFPIGEASKKALNRSHESVYEPIVIQSNDKHLRLLDAYVLLFAQSQMLTLMNSYVQKQKESSDILRAASADLSSTLNLQDIFEKVLVHMQKLIQFDHACILTIENDYLIINAHSENTNKHNISNKYISLDHELVREVLDCGTAIMRQSFKYDSFFQCDYDKGDTRNWMAVPLITGGTVIGMITMDSHENENFNEETSQLLQLFANQAASPIQNAILYFQERRRARQMEVLNNVTSSLVSTLELQPLLEKILTSAVNAIPAATRGALYIYDSDQQKPRVGAVYGIDKVCVGDMVNDAEWNRIANVKTERIPFIINDNVQNDIYSQQDGDSYTSGKTNNCMIILPLIHEDKLSGVITLGSDRFNAFSHDDIQIMQVFGTTATAAICNAQLHYEVEQLAVTDALTTLYNRRGFYHLAIAEVNRSLRYPCSLSIIIIDIDFFKRINDKYGHDIGDQVLRLVALLCKTVVRSTDLICRYGGEEFIILLPETDEQQAVDAAERLRVEISDTMIDTSLGMVSVTVSIGVAGLFFGQTEPEKALELLIKRADRALYTAKMGGRNRVTLWNQESVQKSMHNSDGFEVDQLTETLYKREEELRLLEAASQATQEHLSSILQNASEAIISVNRTNHILMFNKSAEVMFGYHAADIMGQKLNILLPDQFDLSRYIQYSVNTKEQHNLMLPRRQQLTGKKIDGFEFPLEASYSSFGVNGDIFFTVILTDITENIEAENKIRQYNLELSNAYDKTIEGWARALELRDLETHGHSNRVVELTLKIARHIGIREEDLVHIRRGALLHDIGKIAIPDSIMLKKGPLSEEEWQIMYQHPLIADKLLSPIDFLNPAMHIPRYHHEKWDGSGYPYGLKGAQIPLAARIFAVVDVWDALINERPYKPAWEIDKALHFIKEASGSHFDPLVVKVFLKVITGDD